MCGRPGYVVETESEDALRGRAAFLLLSLPAVAMTDAGCSHPMGEAFGAPIEVPAITAQPASQAVAAGQTATFSVLATATSPLSYQWQKNDTAIGDAFGPSYTTPPTVAADSGERFRVVVTDSAGSVTSDEAILAVTKGSPG